MKGKLGCLIKDTRIIKDIEEILYEFAAEEIGVLGKDFTFSKAYKNIRDSGIEIDMESLGVIYKKTFNTQDGNFSTNEDIDKLTGATFSEHIDKVVSATPFVSEREIGDRSPGSAAADDIIKLYEDITSPKFGAHTLMSVFKQKMAKAAKNFIDKNINIKNNISVIRGEIDRIQDLLSSNNNLEQKEIDNLTERQVKLERHIYNLNIDREIYEYNERIESQQKEIDLYEGNPNRINDYNRVKGEQLKEIKEKKKYIDNNPKIKEEDNFTAILTSAFLLNETGYKNEVTGRINSTFEVVEEFKLEMEEYLRELKQKVSNEPGTTFDDKSYEQVEKYINEVISQKYDLLLSKKEMHNIIKTALVKKGIAKSQRLPTGEDIMVFDWTKITNAAQDTDYMKRIVTEALVEEIDDQGNRIFSDNQVNIINDALKREYERYRADIVENRLTELENKNKIKKASTRPNKAKTIVSLYNMGWFETEPDRYDKIINDLVGLDNLDVDTFNKLQDIGKALNTIYSHSPGNEDFTKSVINRLAEDVAIALNEYQKNTKKATINILGRQLNIPIYTFMRWYQAFMGLVMRSTLFSVSNALIANQFSGYLAVVRNNINYKLYKKPFDQEYYDMTNDVAWAIHRDIRLNGGQQYGDLASTFYTRGEIDIKVKDIESKAAQEAISFILNKTLLDASDSYFKIKLTMTKMFKNMTDVIVKIREEEYMASLEKKHAGISDFRLRNEAIQKEFNHDKKDRIKKHTDDAMAEISSRMNKGTLESKRVEARKIIDEVNKNKKILDNSPEAVTRLAHDLLKSNLIEIGGVKKEHVVAAFNASYRAAGYEIGHVPNNFISAGVKKINQHFAQMVEKAKKANDMINEIKYMFIHTTYNTLLNPFLGGGTNWTMIAFENTGFGYIRSFWQSGKELKDIDSVLTDKGLAELEEALYNENKRLVMKVRGGTGFITNLVVLSAVFGALAAFGDDDEDEKDKKTYSKQIYDFFKDNRWVYKYIKELPVLYLKHGISIFDQKDYTTTYEFLGLQYGSFEYGSMWQDFNKLREDGKVSEAEGKIGEIVGKAAGSPVPMYKFLWQFWELSSLVTSFTDVYGDDSKKWWEETGKQVGQKSIDYSRSKNFAQGFFKSGVVNTLGGRKDLWGILDASHTLSTLPGAGKATLGHLKEIGIDDIEKLKTYIIEKEDIKDISGSLRRIKKTSKDGKKLPLFNKDDAQKIEEIMILGSKNVVPLEDIFNEEQMKLLKKDNIHTMSYLAKDFVRLIKYRGKEYKMDEAKIKEVEEKVKEFVFKTNK